MKLDKATLNNGQYVSCTVRRANCTNLFLGWFTVWKTKRHFAEGNCEHSIDIKNVLLGDNELNIQEVALKFIIDYEDEWANDLNKMLSKPSAQSETSRIREELRNANTWIIEK